MMKKLVLSISFLLLFFGTYWAYIQYNKAPVDNSYKPKKFYLGGIQINEANQDDWVAMLKKINMNTVEVSVYAIQGEWDSDSLRFDETDEKALAEIRAAKKGGMNVALILRMDLDFGFERNRFVWHGMIMPKNELLLNWFARYQLFATKWAAIAEQEGVNILGVASEMNALASTRVVNATPKLYSFYNDLDRHTYHEKRAFNYEKTLKSEDLWLWGYKPYQRLIPYIEDRIQRHYEWSQQVSFAAVPNSLEELNKRGRVCQTQWKNILQEVRKHYSGKITYAANFDNYMEVDFWEDLDFMGINAYFGLRGASEIDNAVELKSALKSGWQQAFSEVNAFRMEHNFLEKPLLFTELGYVNRKNSTIEPWAGFGFSVVGYNFNERLVIWGKEEKNLEERKFAMDALYEVVKEQHINLEGILYWKLTTHDYHMPYEPFALNITPNATDSLQTSLSKFAFLVEE